MTSAFRPPPRPASQPPSGPAKTELRFDGSFASPAIVADKPSPATVHLGAWSRSEKKTEIWSVLIETSAVTAPPIAIVRLPKLRTAISGLALVRLRYNHHAINPSPKASVPRDQPLAQPQSLPVLK